MTPLSWLPDPSSSVVTLLIVLCLYCVLGLYQQRHVFPNIPPGPRPWPLVGNFGGFLVPSAIRRRFGGNREKPAKNAASILADLGEVHGSVYRIYAGSQLVVVLNGYEVVRDALANHPHVFSDRPDIPAISIMTKRKGIVFAPYGPLWRNHRRFCLTTLRNFGLGRLSLEPCIMEGLATIKTELLRLDRESGGGGVNPAPVISSAVSNVICSLVLGQRFRHDDQEFRTMLRLMDRGLEICVNSPAVLINVFPLLYHLPFGVFSELRQVERDITAFLKRFIANHRETLDPDNPRDLTDMYLMEISARQAAGEVDSGFTEDYLFYIIGDLFIAGTDTTANSVLWIILYMALFPDIQDKVQAEIDEVVGTLRTPSLSDKGKLPFTEAAIMEVQRLTAVVPLAIPHMTSQTIEFRGYTIPKGTVVLPNLWSVHRDPTVWDEPDSFNPTRFLDKEGKLLRKECFIPFGIGRRVCMGEQLAKMELFLTVTTLLQAFEVRLPEGVPPPPLHGRFGLTLAPFPYTVCINPRRGATDRAES